MPDQKLDRLREAVRSLEKPTRAVSRFTLGAARIDARLDGGLARASLHEVIAAGERDLAAASGFALLLAWRARQDDLPILCVRDDQAARDSGALYAPGLVELGIDPARLILIHAPDTLATLRAAAEIIGCTPVGALLIEPARDAKRLDLTASRRLALAAEASGVTALIVRHPASAMASAAATRWQVAASPSTALAGNAPGMTALAVELLRHRGGIPRFSARLEWDRDQLCFAEAPVSRAVLPLSGNRDVAGGLARAA